MMIKKIKQTILVFALLLGMVGLFNSPNVSAADRCGSLAPGQLCCDGVVVSVLACDGTNGNGINSLLVLIINILSAGIGVAALGGIVYGSILYASAADSSEQTKKAITIITDIVIGLVAYAFLYAFLNYIIPGGLFPLLGTK